MLLIRLQIQNEVRYEESSQFTTFQKRCNITKHLEN